METKIITPAEARALAETNYPVVFEKCITEVSEKIEMYAKQGRYKIDVPGHVIPKAVPAEAFMNAFREAGYCVIEDTEGGIPFYRISW